MRRCYVSELEQVISIPKEEKAILLVGETGPGKTTLVNAIANYYYGMQWKDEFRLVLISNEDEAKERCSSKSD